MRAPPKQKRVPEKRSLPTTGLAKTCHNTESDSQSKGIANKTASNAEAGTKDRHFYRPLAVQFRHDGFNYRQIAREKDVAIYEQTWNGGSRAYEVVRVRRRDGFMIHGRFVEPAEVYPASEAWGTDGFTVTDKDRAFAKLRELCR